jgi:putative hydrolase of the HAD superfamily
VNTKYTHVFFDLDNTLWDFERNSEIAMRITFDHFLPDSSTTGFRQFFLTYSKHNHALWERYRQKEIVKKELIKRRFQDTFSELGISGVNPEQMNAFYLNEMPKQKLLFPGVLETLEYLQLKRYQMFIITNGFTAVQHKKLENSGLKSFFIKVFTSEQIKTPKPGKEIFEYAIKSANAKKVNSLMIGDDWDVDVLGAIKFGIAAIHFENNEMSPIEEIPNKINNHIISKIGMISQLQEIL